MQSFFVTATDTDAGKTEVTALLLRALAIRGLRTVAMKPIAAGCELIPAEIVQGEPAQLKNSDALTLQQAATLQLPYALVNPFAYAPPIAPHIAAAMVSDPATPTVAALLAAYQRLHMLDADVLLCEGAGGWQLPINQDEYLSDFVTAANMPVILVVSMRLGCINHALLSAEAIQARGLRLAGWVANQASPEQMPFYQENIASIQQRVNAPLLAEVPYFSPVDSTIIAVEADSLRQSWIEQELQKATNLVSLLGY